MMVVTLVTAWCLVRRRTQNTLKALTATRPSRTTTIRWKACSDRARGKRKKTPTLRRRSFDVLIDVNFLLALRDFFLGRSAFFIFIAAVSGRTYQPSWPAPLPPP